MRIDTITSNNFQGKFHITERLPQKEQKFAERFINYYADGLTNEEYLKKRNFDIDISSASKKKRLPHKLSLSVNLKYIGTDKDNRGAEMTESLNEIIYIDSGLTSATYYLRSFIDGTDSHINSHLPTQYNSKFEKFLVKTAMFLGIL